MADTDKLSIDSVIARLLEGIIDDFRHLNMKVFFYFLNYQFCSKILLKTFFKAKNCIFQ